MHSGVFKAVLDNLPVIYYRVNDKGRVLELAGKRVANLRDYTSEIEGQHLRQVFPSIGARLNLARQYGEYFFETVGLFNQQDVWFAHYLFKQETGDTLVGVAMDVSDTKRTQQALLRQSAEKQRLAKRMLQVEEDVRQHMASDLHDEIGQSITAINTVASSMLQEKDATREFYTSQINTILDISSDMYDAAHELMYRLRPTVLESLGLEESLRSCIRASRLEQSKVDVKLEVVGDIDSIDKLIQLTIYRVIQESLTNISKHAEASAVKLKVERKTRGNDSDLIDMIISDDGIGFDENIRTGMGLINLKERIQALGGVITINSKPGYGVNIHARINMASYIKSDKSK